MPPLPEFQSAMSRYLTSAPGPEVPALLRNLLPPGSSRPDKRFAVYKNNVYARLVDALRDTFPAIERLVGEEFFRYAAVEYIAQTPPVTASLLAYGNGFPEFLAGFPAVAQLPYLGDVARLELLYLEAYHAADAEPSGDASAVTPDDDIFPKLHPSARLMTSPFQVSRIWELNRGAAAFEEVALPPLREYLLVIRPARKVEVRRVPFGVYAALFAFAQGASCAGARDEAEWAEPGFDFRAHYESLARGGTFVAGTTERIHRS
ncbi:MAG: putative DNA-binding domain-containing protein [Alphaproteobacteria bacterium]|nr:putative DNA-binding domain-containing protein [Alphaproteobacteria bacterium]MDE2072417.1 putative DNA-binding domain-containing protein [Alphaproteobacteria bacterium]MDE2352300.1 putative DNA-binding domain-containing protein [Alphaproteobacteria bacterium]